MHMTSTKHSARPAARSRVPCAAGAAAAARSWAPALQQAPNRQQQDLRLRAQAASAPFRLGVVGGVDGATPNLRSAQNVDGGHPDGPEDPAPVLAIHGGLLLGGDFSQAPLLAAVQADLAPDHLPAPACMTSRPVPCHSHIVGRHSDSNVCHLEKRRAGRLCSHPLSLKTGGIVAEL